MTALARRGFLKAGAAAGGGLLVGFQIPMGGRGEVFGATPQVFSPNAFIRIAPDDVITVIVGKSEMGQGVFTSLPMLVAEELEADWKRIRVESAPVDAAYNHPQMGMQFTGGSMSVASSWEPLRSAGATAREMLISAAAETWKVDRRTLRAEKGRVFHDATKRSLSYGALADAAAKVAPPSAVTLKEPKDFKIIGKPTPRLDTPEKVNGKAQFAMDVALPGMMIVLVARPPSSGGAP